MTKENFKKMVENDFETAETKVRLDMAVGLGGLKKADNDPTTKKSNLDEVDPVYGELSIYAANDKYYLIYIYEEVLRSIALVSITDKLELYEIAYIMADVWLCYYQDHLMDKVETN